MSLFKKQDKSSCCCGECNEQTMAKAEASKTEGAAIKILGTGCAKCNELEKNTKEALAELGMDTIIDHVTDFSQIAAYGVMTTPALVKDNKVISLGKVLSKKEIIDLLKKNK